MITNRIQNIYEEIIKLPKEEFNVLLSRLNIQDKQEIKESIFNLLSQNTINDMNICPHCGCAHVNLWNKKLNRYYCRDCRKTFSKTTNSIFFKFKRNMENKWVKFIDCFVNGLSLPKCSKSCDITIKTAFNWRHKILNVIHMNYQNDKVSGLIEMDETYFRKSNKGTKVQKPRHHGYCPNLEDQRGLSKDKICISTAIDRNKKVFINYTCLGIPSSQSLSQAYKNGIEHKEKSRIIVDGCLAYNKFAENNQLAIKRLEKKIENKNWKINKIPVIKGIFHIQNVNNFHGQIGELIDKTFKGVGTKYLIQYINYVKWLRLNKLNNKSLLNLCLSSNINVFNKEISQKEVLKI